jgi:DHA2 family multidrug resistance protein
VFTLASGLCGVATGLSQLILFRVLQGLAGGGLQPSSQGVLLDAFPVERQRVAMTLFGLAALIAPVVGRSCADDRSASPALVQNTHRQG